VDAVVEGGAVGAVVPLLSYFPPPAGMPAAGAPPGEDVEKEACFILGLLAIKQVREGREERRRGGRAGFARASRACRRPPLPSSLFF